jgi:hypothetical protein
MLISEVPKRMLAEGHGHSEGHGEGGEHSLAEKVSTGCARYMSASAHMLKEHVESVHYSFFVAMCFYFILMAISLQIHYGRFRNEAKKANMHGFEDRVTFLLSKAKNWPKTAALISSNPKVARLVESNTMCYQTYIKSASAGFIDIIIEFPVWSWVILGLYQLLNAILAYDACLEEHITHLIFQLMAYVVMLWLGVRAAIFYSILASGKGEKDPYPMAAAEKFNPIGPFCTGHAFFLKLPSRRIALCVQQAWMWYTLQRVSFLVVNIEGSLYEPGEDHEFIGPLIDVCVTFVGLLVYSVAVFPFVIEMYSLPPLLDDTHLDDAVVEALKDSAESMEPGGAKEITATVSPA